MSKQKFINVNGVNVRIGMHPIKKFLMWSGVLSWLILSIFAYVQLKGDIFSNSSSIGGLLAKGNSEYMIILSQRESGKNFSVVGGSHDHYLGGFQFGRVAMKDIGLINTRREYREFRRNFVADGTDFWSQAEQERACMMLMKKNKYYLRNHYRYIGKTIRGVKINEAGMLSAAHLVGHGAVKEFLESNGSVVAKDGFGTPITEYFELMKGVSVEL